MVSDRDGKERQVGDRCGVHRLEDHMHVLAPLLTERYAPLRPNGHGLQSIYLTALEPAFADALLTLLGPEMRALAAGAHVRDRPFDASRAPGQGQTEWEEHLIGAIRAQPIDETEKTALILARRGQGLFKQRVRQVEVKCRITGVDRIEHLRRGRLRPYWTVGTSGFWR